MKYTDKDIQQAIELSQYAANKCSELEDYSIEMEEQLFRLQRKCSLIRTLQITTHKFANRSFVRTPNIKPTAPQTALAILI
jgi:hypothetical protein